MHFCTLIRYYLCGILSALQTGASRYIHRHPARRANGNLSGRGWTLVYKLNNSMHFHDDENHLWALSISSPHSLAFDGIMMVYLRHPDQARIYCVVPVLVFVFEIFVYIHLFHVEHSALVYLLRVVLELYFIGHVDVVFTEDFLPCVEIFPKFGMYFVWHHATS